MAVRRLVVVFALVGVTAGAIVVIAGALDGGTPVLRLTADEPAATVAWPAPQAEPEHVPASAVDVTHVKAWLATIPDVHNLAGNAGGVPVPGVPGLALRHFRRNDIVAGAIEILRDGATVAVFHGLLEFIPLDASHLVLHRSWHGPEVEVFCLDVARLAVLPEAGLVERAAAIAAGDELVACEGGACEAVTVARDLEPGVHGIHVPEPAREAGEILLLYPTTRGASPHATHLMRIEPALGRVTVVAPRGRAFRSFDAARGPFRLLRDPVTGRAAGDGADVAAFVLSPALAAVDHWLD